MSENNQDLELAPLVADEQTAFPEKSSFSKAFRATIALGALLILGAVATFSYEKTRAMRSSTNLSIFETSQDLALCDNTYIYGLTPRTAQEGCVVLSIHDMYGDNAEELAMPTKTICIASSGPNAGKLDVDYDLMESLGFIDQSSSRKGLSILSGISPGKSVTVHVFSEKHFQGETTTIRVAAIDGELPQKLYPSGAYTNDNVMSLKIIADVDYYFAGPRCGVSISVCINENIPHDDLVKEPEDGCLVMATADPTVPGKENGHFIATRFCAGRDAGQVAVSKDNMKLTKLIHTDRDYHSLVSYVRKAQNVNLAYYSGTHLDGFRKQTTGTLSHTSYEGKVPVRDNVYSFEYSSHTWGVPKSCEF